MSRYLMALLLVALTTAAAPVCAASNMVMLPPTSLGTTTQCSSPGGGLGQILTYGGVSNSATGQAAINCITGATIDSGGDLTLGGSLTASGSITGGARLWMYPDGGNASWIGRPATSSLAASLAFGMYSDSSNIVQNVYLQANNATQLSTSSTGVTINNALTIYNNAKAAYALTINNGNITVGGSVLSSAYYHSSDARLKTDIRPIDNALDKMLAIRGVTFNWKKDGRPDMGVVAQNVAEVFPNVVTKNKDGMMAVEYDSLVGPMIESMRELKDKTDRLESENTSLRAKVAGLDTIKAQLTQIRAMLESKMGESVHTISAEPPLDDHASGPISH